jgi:N-acetylmuramoyl-L-alanine amidase/CubicO group peptidase (beta-lactamase class C family)
LKNTIRAIALALVFALALSSCGTKTGQETAVPPESSPAVTSSVSPETGTAKQDGGAPQADLPVQEAGVTDSPAQSAELVETSDQAAERPLAGFKIGIDAGHQKSGNSEQEPVAPGSSEKKAKVTSGTHGRVTGVPEHTVNLQVALLLEQKLLALGADVVMVRTTEDVDISNVERATMMNDAGVDLVVRIHADGSEDPSVRGASMLVPASQITDKINGDSRRAGEIIFEEFIAATGAKDRGVIDRRDLSGFNWSTIPAVLIELGYMTNADEDELLVSPEYQDLCAEGLVRGVAKWAGALDLRQPETEDDKQQTANPSPAEVTAAEINRDIQAAVDGAARKYGAAGIQVAVIRNGEIYGTFVYGDATKGEKPMDDDVKMRVASISKVVLGMTVMKLREQGKIDIDADIGDYWGAPVRNPNHSDIPITMRQILSHTSSIRVYDYGFEAGGELVRVGFLDGSCFGRSAPGQIGSWNYNNYAFSALGITVETALGETVNSLAAEHLFAPLGIDAAFGTGSIADTDNLATIYTQGGGVGRSVDAQKRTLGSTYPGEKGEEFPGGLTISSYDLAKLIAVLANDGEYNGTRILSAESVELMEESQGKTGGGFEQCLPLRHRADLYGEDELYYHTGSNYGVFNLISYNPVTGNGVVVLTSGASGAQDAYGIYAVCGEISEYVYGVM